MIDSPTTIGAASRVAFLLTHRVTCSCTPLELRECGAALRCANCDAPVIRRHRSAVESIPSRDDDATPSALVDAFDTAAGGARGR